MNYATSTTKSPEQLTALAEGGDLGAQCEMGMMYEHGISVRKDYQAAILWYTTAATRGSEFAQCKLAAMFENGYGVKQDYQQAAFWLRKAAESGLLEAQYRLGFMMEQGRETGCPKYSEAVEWYLAAEKQGSVEASLRLGLLYDMGSGIPKNTAAAAHHYKFAASHGNANAQYNLGVLYVTGDGVNKDLTQAAKLFEAAASHGHRKARDKYDETMEIVASSAKKVESESTMARRRRLAEEAKEDSLFKQLSVIVKKAAPPATPSVLAILLSTYTPLGQILAQFTAQNKGAMVVAELFLVVLLIATLGSFFKWNKKPDWFKVSAAGLITTLSLGGAFLLLGVPAQGSDGDDGIGIASASAASSSDNTVKVDPEKARRKAEVRKQVAKTNSELLRNATKGSATAQVKLALRYEFGTGLDKSPSWAAHWFAKAAKQNNKFAQCRLGMMYKEGIGVESDSKMAVKLLQQSAKQNYAPAAYQLGLMNEFGQDVKKNLASAAIWYQKGSKLEERHNQYRLGLMLLSGNGIAQAPVKGLKLVESAATKGLPAASAKMSEVYKFGQGVSKSDEIASRWKRQSEKLQIILPGTEEWLYQEADNALNEAVEVSNSKRPTTSTGFDSATTLPATDKPRC